MRLYVLCLPLLLVLGPSQGTSRSGRLDKSQAFYYPQFAAEAETVLGKTTTGPISSGTYVRYLAGRLGTRYLEDLAFDIALARECQARGVARSAPILARSLGARRFHESGRHRAADPDGTLQRKFANESLQRLRVDALVSLKRADDDAALSSLFNRRYGVGGKRVQVRQVLVSFDATRKRLQSARKPTGDVEVTVAARARAESLYRRVKTDGFVAVLAETDERVARRMLRDPARRSLAGVLEGYNYVRYGDSFAVAVRALEVAGVAGPVRTGTGFHIIQLVSRKTTSLVNVEAELRQALRRGPAKPADIQALRKELLKKYEFEVNGGGR